MIPIEHIARITHEANRAYCKAFNDESQESWESAPEWQKKSAIAGVTAILEGKVTSPEQSHQSWLSEKVADGWKYGDVKDAEKKEHPCVVPYEKLPLYQRKKDELFTSIVRCFIGGK